MKKRQIKKRQMKKETNKKDPNSIKSAKTTAEKIIQILKSQKQKNQ